MKPLIYIVDDDISVRRALKRLISSVGMDVRTFTSTHEFLEVKKSNGRKDHINTQLAIGEQALVRLRRIELPTSND